MPRPPASRIVRGITRRTYPCVLGNTPIPNFIAGWLSFVVAGVVFAFTDVPAAPVWSLVAIAVGVLLMGLFPAGPGASGRRESVDAADTGHPS